MRPPVFTFSIDLGSDNSQHGLLIMNHEYVDSNLFHTIGGYKADPEDYNKEKVDKEMAVYGVSAIKIKNHKNEQESATIVMTKDDGEMMDS